MPCSYAVDVACVQNVGSKSFDKQVSVLAKPEEHTKSCLMMSICIKARRPCQPAPAPVPAPVPAKRRIDA